MIVFKLNQSEWVEVEVEWALCTRAALSPSCCQVARVGIFWNMAAGMS